MSIQPLAAIRDKPLIDCLKFGSFASNGVCINRREPPKLGSTWAPPPCTGDVADPLEIHLSPRVMPNLVVLGQTVWALLQRSAWKIWPPASHLSTSRPVIRTATYDFLITFHSNHGPISFHFWDKRRFQLETANFPTPAVLNAALKRFPLELDTGTQRQKPEWWGYQAEKKFGDIFSHLETIHERDRQTVTGRQQRPRITR